VQQTQLFFPSLNGFTMNFRDFITTIWAVRWQRVAPARRKAIQETLLITGVIVGLLLFFYFPIENFYYQRQNEQVLLDIKRVNPESYETFKAFIQHIEATTDWEVQIVSGYRDKAHQAQLKKQNSKNAPAGKSKHNMGKAIDINVVQKSLFSSKRLLKSSSKQQWEASEITAIAKLYNLHWGGDFKNYHDPVHFELD
jgi:D-alanyl-D-alanine carboxypeptidase